MANERTVARIAARIKERVAHCIEFELNDPRSAFITLTKVELARDLATVKVFYSVLGSDADRTKAGYMLESATGFVQRQLGRVLRTRRIPRIAWHYDDTIELMARMDRLIDDALAHDRAINPAAHASGTALPTGELPPGDTDDAGLVDYEYEEFLDRRDDEE
jgi:ribosome-binding factor A